jgi:hypothetical protein
MSEVFISYATANVEAARAMKAKLEANNVSCFLAADDPRIGDWRVRLSDEIRTCTYVFLIADNAALVSAEVKAELTIARHENKEIVVGRWQIEIDDLPPELRTGQVFDLKKDPEAQIVAADLAKRLAISTVKAVALLGAMLGLALWLVGRSEKSRG